MKNCDEMVESLFKRRARYMAIKERRNKEIRRVVLSLCLVALIGLGIWKGPAVVNASLKRLYPRYDNKKFWEYNTNVDSEKTIESDKLGLNTESIGSEEKEGSQDLTYEITNKMNEENHLDVYVDPDQNQYSYDENGTLIAYKQNPSNERDLPYGQEPCTEEESIRLARAYLYKLFGARVEGFVFANSNNAGIYAGYDIIFAKKYGVGGFIEGPSAYVILQQNGDLTGATISSDLMEEFDPKSVENLTKEKVAKWAIAEVESMEECIPGSATVAEQFYLQRSKNGFSIRALVDYTIIDESTGQEQLGEKTVYYEID